jgi:hypothetical protein
MMRGNCYFKVHTVKYSTTSFEWPTSALRQRFASLIKCRLNSRRAVAPLVWGVLRFWDGRRAMRPLFNHICEGGNLHPTYISKRPKKVNLISQLRSSTAMNETTSLPGKKTLCGSTTYNPGNNVGRVKGGNTLLSVRMRSGSPRSESPA